jgi:hypothetical protein
MKKIIWLLLIIMPIILLGATAPSTGQNFGTVGTTSSTGQNANFGPSPGNANFGMDVQQGARRDSQRLTPVPRSPSKMTIKRNNEWLRSYRAVPPPSALRKETGAPKTMAPETRAAPSTPTPY